MPEEVLFFGVKKDCAGWSLGSTLGNKITGKDNIEVNIKD